MVIENCGGASGSIGAIEAARAAPDGYTWMFAYDNEATNQTLLRLPYKTLEAFAPVSLVATGPLALVAHSSTPYRNFQDLVAAAKAAPDTISFASSGVGGLAHVSTTLLQQQGGFSLVHVPYRGGGPAVQDAVSGQVPLFMSNVVIISQHIRAGTLRPLGVTTLGETRHVPGVASFAQQGFAGFEAPTWWAFFGRAGTPEPIRRRMQEALAKALSDPEVRARIEEQGCDVRRPDRRNAPASSLAKSIAGGRSSGTTTSTPIADRLRTNRAGRIPDQRTVPVPNLATRCARHRWVEFRTKQARAKLRGGTPDGCTRRHVNDSGGANATGCSWPLSVMPKAAPGTRKQGTAGEKVSRDSDPAPSGGPARRSRGENLRRVGC